MKKHYRLLFLVFFASTFFVGNAMAQQKTLIRGFVKEEGKNEMIIGVSIAEIDNTNRVIGGTSTDQNGEFSLRVSNVNNKLQFVIIGYKTKLEEIKGRSNITVEMESSDVNLSEVVVSAKEVVNDGNMNIARRDLTSAVSKIEAKDLEDLQATTIDEALQGRMSGVDIVASTGDPGAGMAIRIRGTSSIGLNADPMIVIDGIPFEASIDADFNFSSADEENYAQLINVPTSDIKDISVLKDAASTAQYGSKAANGVIVITTKRGSKGRVNVNFTSKNTVSVQPDGIPMLSGDQYTMMINEAYVNYKGKIITPSLTSFPDFNYDTNSPGYYLHTQNTDWVKAITQTGHTYENNLSLSGGGEKAVYRFSVGYLGQTGTTIGTYLGRLSTRSNFDYNISDKIKIAADISYLHSSNDRNYNSNILEVAQKRQPNLSIYQRDVNGNPTDVYFTPGNDILYPDNYQSQGSGLSYYNPLAMANEAKMNVKEERIVPTFKFTYKMIPSLRFQYDINFNIQSKKTHSFLPLSAVGILWTDNSANKTSDNDYDTYSIYSAGSLIWQPDLGRNHQLSVLGKFVTEEVNNSQYSAATFNTASTSLSDPSVLSNIIGSAASINSGYSQSREVSQLINLNYVLYDRYIISGSIRRDGSSKFGENNRYGSFPSVGFKWRVSGEPWMKSYSFINDFGFRANYGVLGTPPSASYSYFNTYETYNYSYAGLLPIRPTSVQLANLRWESTAQANIGANLDMFDNRISMDLDFYRKRTSDLMLPGVTIPSTSGFSSLSYQNVGTMDNQGVEFSLNTQIVKGEKFSMFFDFNIAHNENIIRELSPNYPQDNASTGENANFIQRLEEGHPLGSFYGFRYKGVYSTPDETIARDKSGNQVFDFTGKPVYIRYKANYQFVAGDAKYEDVNNDGNINHLDIVYLGDANPVFTGGFGPRFVFWKNLSLNLFFNYRYGNDIINSTKANTQSMNNYDNQSTAVLRRWRNDGDITDVPRAVIGTTYNDLASSRFVEDGSFLRLKSVTFSYNMPKNILKKMNVTSCKVYLNLSNIITFTKYSGQDPEVSYSSGSDPFKIGIDNTRTPRSKECMLGINLNF